MVTLWTDVIDPATLTGYMRESLAAYEARQGSLETYLNNEHVPDIAVSFDVGAFGLTQTARFRAYDAEPEYGKEEGGKRVMIELPAIGQKIAISEYRALRQRNASEKAMLDSILKTADRVVRAVSDRMELLRGVVLDTGKATVAQSNFKIDDDFGRPAGHTVTAAAYWSIVGTDRIADLLAWQDTYRATNAVNPGVMVMSSTVYSQFRKGTQFQNTVTGRPMTAGEINSILVDEGLPPITIFDRRVNFEGTLTPVLPVNKVLYLPAAQDSDMLGKTYWGTTLTATDLGWGIADDEQAGIVAGVYRNEQPPVIAEVISDAIGMPVLGNAALSFSAKVLA
jgi:hypothetical protein